MRRPFAVGIFAILIWAEMATSSALAQMPPRGRELDREREEALKEFATRVRRIALHYDQAGDREKAKGTLRLLLQTLPNDQEAKALLEKISKQELTVTVSGQVRLQSGSVAHGVKGQK